MATSAADPLLVNPHENGLFYGGGFYLLRGQLLGVAVAFLWSGVMTALILYATECVLRQRKQLKQRRGLSSSDRRLLIRVCEEDELLGLDVAEYLLGSKLVY